MMTPTPSKPAKWWNRAPDKPAGEALKACPFCGEATMFRKALWPSDGCVDAIIHRDPSQCGLQDFSTGTVDESAIAAWNTRATLDPTGEKA